MKPDPADDEVCSFCEGEGCEECDGLGIYTDLGKDDTDLFEPDTGGEG